MTTIEDLERRVEALEMDLPSAKAPWHISTTSTKNSNASTKANSNSNKVNKPSINAPSVSKIWLMRGTNASTPNSMPSSPNSKSTSIKTHVSGRIDS